MTFGCVHPTQRTGDSLLLGDRAPANECERAKWLDLAPAKTASSEQELVDWKPRAREAEGLALFDVQDHALDLRKVVPAMKEESLSIPLQTYVEPVHARNREAAYWLLGSVAAMALGIGYAATGGNDLRADHIAAMSAGLTLGMAGAVTGLVRMPKKRARMEADLRRSMFVDGEYDPATVRRGTLVLREQLRQQCAHQSP